LDAAFVRLPGHHGLAYSGEYSHCRRAGHYPDAESGFRLLRRLHFDEPVILTWLFFFLYGPVEVALPVYVAHDLHADAGLLGTYWTAFGIGALVAALITHCATGTSGGVTLLIVAAGVRACCPSSSPRLA